MKLRPEDIDKFSEQDFPSFQKLKKKQKQQAEDPKKSSKNIKKRDNYREKGD